MKARLTENQVLNPFIMSGSDVETWLSSCRPSYPGWLSQKEGSNPANEGEINRQWDEWGLLIRLFRATKPRCRLSGQWRREKLEILGVKANKKASIQPLKAR